MVSAPLTSFTCCMSVPCGSDGKESACNAGDPGSIPGLGRPPWRREWQPTPVFLPGESHGRKEPGRLQSIESQRVQHDRSTTQGVSKHSRREAALKSTHLVTFRGIFRFQMRGRGVTGCTLVAAKEKGHCLGASLPCYSPLLLSDVLSCQHGHEAAALPSRQRTRGSRLLHGSGGCLD